MKHWVAYGIASSRKVVGKSLKDHVCYECEKVIPKGQSYVRWQLPSPPGVLPKRPIAVHIECRPEENVYKNFEGNGYEVLFIQRKIDILVPRWKRANRPMGVQTEFAPDLNEHYIDRPNKWKFMYPSKKYGALWERPYDEWRFESEIRSSAYYP